ncbi:hypothetical protein L1O48_08300 [Ligilactobacillus equi]|uniref:hypothetical protein n=1 Tax=Ligilactobacillus equi TaxID=137357 RepID=UPI002ECFFED5
MFQKVIHQLENSQSTLYSEASCRIFLMQAYQELTLMRIKYSQNQVISEQISEILDRFFAVEEDALEAYDNIHHLVYRDVRDEVQTLIDFIKSKDIQLV